jgi:hypothetical protein
MRYRYGYAILMVLGLAMVSVGSASGDDLFGNWFGRTEKGSGNLETEQRDLGPFVRIQSEIGIDLQIKIGEPQSVSLTIDDNLLDNVKTRVRGKTLVISSRGSFSTHRNAVIEITVAKLEEISLEGSGDIRVDGLNGERFDFNLAGSGSLIASGKVQELEISVDGSGNVDTEDLTADDVHVEVNGSGDVKVAAAKSFDGVINGSGNIIYFGDPEDISTNVYGSGSIRHH